MRLVLAFLLAACSVPVSSTAIACQTALANVERIQTLTDPAAIREAARETLDALPDEPGFSRLRKALTAISEDGSMTELRSAAQAIEFGC